MNSLNQYNNIIKNNLSNKIAISIKNLNIRLKHSPYSKIVENISFDLYPGKILALVGESGSGKSITALSIFRLLPDTLKISDGSIKIYGQDVLDLTENEMTKIRGKKIAMIFQDPQSCLNPIQTISTQINETLLIHTDLNSKERYQRIEKLFKIVQLPETDAILNYYPHQLSGGQLQRVMIAMALACEPDILIADEPTTALDVTIQKQILEILQQLTKNENLAILLITHDMQIVKNYSDNVAIMFKGTIIEQNSCHLFFQRTKEPYSRKLIQLCSFIKEYRHQIQQEPLLEIRDLKVHFPIKKRLIKKFTQYNKAVDGINLIINKGETVALVGESGCGKTTTAQAILQLVKKTSGHIIFNNTNITSQKLSKNEILTLKRKIQIIFQNPYSSMNPKMTILEIIDEGIKNLQPNLNQSERLQKIKDLLNRIQMDTSCLRKYPHEFSGGQRQRIAIARALAVTPDFIICDEPTSSVDAFLRLEIVDLLLDLQKKLGVSYLFITHDLCLIPKIAHRVAVMYQGKIVEVGTAESIIKNAQHVYTKELLSAST